LDSSICCRMTSGSSTMADIQSNATSVTPSDSVSQATANKKKKNNRPGKNQRNANRDAMTPPASSATGPTSLQHQAMFSSAASAVPNPQPGKFPIVFQVGAGEPTRDSEISYNPNVINDTFNDVSGRFTNAPRFAEFTEYTGYDDDSFARDVLRFSLLGLAQQTVFSHVNMGLPLGDFSSIASTDTFAFSSLRAIISQFGEFSVPSLGTRFLLADYNSTVSSLVHAASRLTDDPGNNKARTQMMWLPMKSIDRRTKHIVASRLLELVLPLGLAPDIDELVNALFERESSAWNAVKTLLADDPDRFDFLFKGYGSIQDWVSSFRPASAQAVLHELGLSWPSPEVNDLNWNFVPKVIFPELVDQWARKRSAFAKFFSIGSGLSNRNDAHGSAAQLSEIRQTHGVTVVKTLVATSAPEFSLAACFPPSVYTERAKEYNVVLTTPIAVKVRATEFTQLDWLM